MWNSPAVSVRHHAGPGSGHMSFPTPAALWEAATQYFQWVEDNPIVEEKLISTKMGVEKHHINHPQAMTVRGLCLYIGLGKSTWYEYCARDEFKGICEEITNCIYMQKFTYAAADMLNASLIARDLGIKDQQEITTKHDLSEATEEELDRKLEELRRLTSESSTETSRD